MDWINFLLLPAIKIPVVLGVVLTSVPFMVYAERRVLGRIQNRPGPNRVGPFGLFQAFADGLKLLFKEDITPRLVDKWLYLAAPFCTLVPALMILVIIPFGPSFQLFGHEIRMGIANLNIGILFYFAVTSLAIYGIILAGWSSNNKYSLLGGLRGSAQMISYELPLGLSVIGIFLLCGTFQLDGAPNSIIQHQAGGFWNWHVISQPIAFFIFLVAGFAETNRLPFDLPEGESELTGGYHTEYSSMKFAMFFMAEYANMFIFAALITTLFLGGYQSPIPLAALGMAEPTGLLAVVWGAFWFSAKVAFFILFFIFIRGTLPRFRYDQLMSLGWRLMLPVALGNIVVTALILAIGLPPTAQTWVLFLLNVAAIVGVDRVLTMAQRRLLNASA